MHTLKWFLWPFSLLYLLITECRNFLFDQGFLSSHKADIKTLVIGNLAIGGSGKTPLTIWFIQEMMKENQIAVLSRGYGRKTQGFRWVTEASHFHEVGDEPLMIKIKYPKIPVAVCEDRIFGVKKIKEKNPQVAWVILDDGFQHRKLKPTFSVIASDYSKPFFKDNLLPFGRLRESRWQIKRANAIVFTKCPPKHNKFHGMEVPSYYSAINYQEYDWVKGEKPKEDKHTIILSGIALSSSFSNEVLNDFPMAKRYSFRDHYTFKQKDLDKISVDKAGSTLITTEKDWVRLKGLDLSRFENVAYLPIKLTMQNNDLINQIQNFNG